MNYRVLDDFVQEMPVSDEVIEEYRGRLPEELLSVWNQLGFGSFMNGYMKVIDPRDYVDVVVDTYFRGNVSIPFMVTGFGDVLTWEKNNYIGLVKFRKRQFDIISSGFKYFFEDLLDNYFITDFFNIPQYEEALAKHGVLKFDECFGYVPLLGTGGTEDVNHLDKVKIIEHISLITQFIGRIE